MTIKTGIIEDVRLLGHKVDTITKECPERLAMIYEKLQTEPYLNTLKRFTTRESTTAEIEAVHSHLYCQQLANYSLNSNPYSYDKDTYLTEESPYIARLSAGGGLVLADAIMSGEIDNGFALIRPPGHHAEPGRGQGFCIFNNVALTAKYLQERYGLNRIMIVDFDVHHGNGTQDIFYDSDEVLFISLHQKNIYPGTGKGNETGSGKGTGYNINIPLPSQFGDNEYSCLFGQVIQNVADFYLPQIILVSAGFDAHDEDSTSVMRLTDDGYRRFAETLRFLADQYCDGKLLYLLEGGYHLPSLTRSVLASLDGLSSLNSRPGFCHSPRCKDVVAQELPIELRQKWNL